MIRRATALAGLLLLAACSSDAEEGGEPAPEGDPALPRVVESTEPAPATAVTTTAEESRDEPVTTIAGDQGQGEPVATTAPAAAPPGGPLPIPVIELVEVARVDRVTEIATRPDDERLFVVSQPGTVEAHGRGTAETVLDVTDRTSADGERGLLGLAFHPTEPLAYVHYTDLGGDTVVAEYSVDPATGSFGQGTERTVFTADQPYSNHNGGELAFGPDGYLYLGLGDGGSADDPERSALDLSSPLGKIHRFDPRPDGDAPLTVPDDNPFAAGPVPTIWSYGLRNPWKFSFDPLTGDLWVTDVGQNTQEEVTRAPALAGRGAGKGLNFGWSAFEGTDRFNADQPADGAVVPTLTYSHADGHCSVSGGAVARGEANGGLAGWYVLGDYCSGTIWGYDTTTVGADATVVELARVPGLTGIAAGPDGALHAFSQQGSVHRLTAAG